MDSPQRFRKRPVVIEAMRWEPDTKQGMAAMLAWVGAAAGVLPTAPYGESWVLRIKTLEGTMEAMPGDWVIKGVQGEFYPCKPSIFEQTYESEEPDA